MKSDFRARVVGQLSKAALLWKRRNASRRLLPDHRWDLRFAFSVICFLLWVTYAFFDEIGLLWSRNLSDDSIRIFAFLTELGKSEFYLVPSALILAFLVSRNLGELSMIQTARLVRQQLRCLYIVISIAGSGLLAIVLKILIGRARPRHFEEFGHQAFFPPGLDAAFQGMPSGHATTAGGLAMSLCILFPAYRWLWICLMVPIAFSRIVLGSHYISDVIAGFSLGAVIALLIARSFAKRRLLFRWIR